MFTTGSMLASSGLASPSRMHRTTPKRHFNMSPNSWSSQKKKETATTGEQRYRQLQPRSLVFILLEGIDEYSSFTLSRSLIRTCLDCSMMSSISDMISMNSLLNTQHEVCSIHIRNRHSSTIEWCLVNEEVQSLDPILPCTISPFHHSLSIHT